MKAIAVALMLASSSTFAQSNEVLECARYVSAVDFAIMNADNQLHDHEVGVKPGNTIPFEHIANIRDEIDHETVQDRFDLRSIVHLGNVPICATIATRAVTKINLILRYYGFEPVTGN